MIQPESKTKTVLITGGAKRIGAAIVRALHAQGMNIVLQYNRSQKQANQLIDSLIIERPGSVIGVQTDLALFNSYSLLSNTVKRHYGRLDVLLNNASGFYSTPVQTASEEDWTTLMSINAKAPFFLAQQCRPLLKARSGCIINITDIYADKPIADYAIYCASKAALTNLTLSMAQSMAPEIRVNAIAPGAILAPEDAGESDMQGIINRTPLNRLGGEESITQAVLFLINQANFVTGQVLNVDGGRSAVHP